MYKRESESMYIKQTFKYIALAFSKMIITRDKHEKNGFITVHKYEYLPNNEPTCSLYTSYSIPIHGQCV